jgi:hypothetical protein
MSSKVFQLWGVVPVPVGHRVEVLIFADPSPDFDAPMVVDLETGIRYSATFTAFSASRIELPVRPPGTPVYGRWTGRVQSCDVVFGNFHRGCQLRTALVVDFSPLPSQPAFR